MYEFTQIAHIMHIVHRIICCIYVDMYKYLGWKQSNKALLKSDDLSQKNIILFITL